MPPHSSPPPSPCPLSDYARIASLINLVGAKLSLDGRLITSIGAPPPGLSHSRDTTTTPSSLPLGCGLPNLWLTISTCDISPGRLCFFGSSSCLDHGATMVPVVVLVAAFALLLAVAL